MAQTVEERKEKQRAWARKKYHENKKPFDYNREKMLRRQYGLTLDGYENMLKAQDGVCAICHFPELRRKTKRLSVDHDHNTGKLRGLLCQKCNSALGYFREDIQVFKNAIDYLKKYQDERAVLL